MFWHRWVHYTALHCLFNIILPSSPKSCKWSVSLRLSDQSSVYTVFLISPMNATCPAHRITTEVLPAGKSCNNRLLSAGFFLTYFKLIRNDDELAWIWKWSWPALGCYSTICVEEMGFPWRTSVWIGCLAPLLKFEQVGLCPECKLSHVAELTCLVNRPNKKFWEGLIKRKYLLGILVMQLYCYCLRTQVCYGLVTEMQILSLLNLYTATSKCRTTAMFLNVDIQCSRHNV
jgi:hypothetical protein